MTVHLLSVGVTVLDFLADPHRKLPDQPDFADAIEQSQAVQVLDDEDRGSTAASHRLADLLDPRHLARLAEVTRQIQPELWPARVSAELQTFASAADTRRLDRRDLAIFLATDTVNGLTAALWNAAALVGGDLDRVRYLPQPDAGLVGARGCAAVIRVPKLDARRAPEFRAAMGSLGRLGRNLLGRGGYQGVAAADEPFRFYLSGGFKAAIPYLIGLAEGLRSLPEAGPVSAFVLHETTDAGAIPLPLRRLPEELVRTELTGFDTQGHRPCRPKTNLLEGYAYDQAGSGWELTAFGEGLRVLFGELPEVAGQ